MKKTIKFRLDGHWDGTGTIETDRLAENDPYEVTLAAPCKEFATGSKILVFTEEIYEISDFIP